MKTMFVNTYWWWHPLQLGVRLCALIRRENQASRKVAEGLGMTCLMETDTQSSEGQLLYGESLV